MKLVTFQSYNTLKFLINNGYLECNEKFINIEKVGSTYSWVLNKIKNILIKIMLNIRFGVG